MDVDARAQQILDLEAALRTCRGQYEVLLVESHRIIHALQKETRYLREHIRLLEKASDVPQPPPCA